MRKRALQSVALDLIASFLCAIFVRAQSANLQQVPAMQDPHTQTINIRLVNGRNGHAMVGQESHVNLWVGTERKPAVVIPTDGNGVARFQLTPDATQVNVPNRPNDRTSIVVTEPVLRYQESFRINVPYVLCQPDAGDYSWLKTMELITSRVSQEGITMVNTCGKAKATAAPGEVIIFVRPLSWWEKLKE